MRSFGSSIAWGFVLACVAASEGHAQSDASVRYETTREQEQLVSMSPAATADDFRFVVNKYWEIVRRYPSTGYSDNALWQAGNLSMESFRRFSQDRDKYRAVQLFQWLRDQYPHSSMITKATNRSQSGIRRASPARRSCEAGLPARACR